MYIGGGRALKNKVVKYRPCLGRTVSFSVLSFMLFFITIVGILPSADDGERNIAFSLAIILFLLHILFVLYSIFKLNSLICVDDNKILQKQFCKIVNIKYDEITDVKLSFAFYIRASYAIKIYENNKRIMFEISSKVFDEFMKCCSNIEVKNKVKSLLEEKEIY